jgi:hypothetical protein
MYGIVSLDFVVSVLNDSGQALFTQDSTSEYSSEGSIASRKLVRTIRNSHLRFLSIGTHDVVSQASQFCSNHALTSFVATAEGIGLPAFVLESLFLRHHGIMSSFIKGRI